MYIMQELRSRDIRLATISGLEFWPVARQPDSPQKLNYRSYGPNRVANILPARHKLFPWRTGWNDNFSASEQSCVERQRAWPQAHDSYGDHRRQYRRHWCHGRLHVRSCEPGKSSDNCHHRRDKGNIPSQKANQKQETNNTHRRESKPSEES